MIRRTRCAVILTLNFFLSFAFQPTYGWANERYEFRILFLGDNGHHRPADRFRQIQALLGARGIEITYTDNARDLNPQLLETFDGLIIYANIQELLPEQEAALLEFVSSGKGLIPLHCASYCFLNSTNYVALVGAQFLRHGTGVIRTTLAEREHPVLKGFRGFESWDETYVHHRHNEQDRTVLEYRVDEQGKEPWTWVRAHGKGRVFYTAWGHDERTWGNPGFQNLLERGIRWAVGKDPSLVRAFADRPEMTMRHKGNKPFEYEVADVPFYPPGRQWGTLESGRRMMQLPVEPGESVKHFVTPVGFELRLFVSEPDLQGKPIAMNWDERGRLWVCETYDYPNELQPRGQGRDRIRICEDTDGDGHADKFTVFAEQLSIPTTLAFYSGGAIVQNGVETVYLKDLDGDDRADLRKVLITGWAMNDTHGGVSNFRYGHDDWYYAMQGYNNSQPVLASVNAADPPREGSEANGRRVTPFRQGFFRFKMAGENASAAVTDFEFLRSTNNNTWGLGLSEEGLVFGSTANGNPSEFMPISNRYYESVRGWSSNVLGGIADSNQFEPVTDKVRQVDFHGGFTAAAGHALYTARNYPREYWNRAAFVCEPTGHLVATFILRPDGAGFRSKNSWNLAASFDEWTSPIMAEVGPDGNVWIIDWYNYIVQHNPTPAGFRTGRGNAYDTPLRDKKHGRIYRLVFTGSTADASAGQRVASTNQETDTRWILRDSSPEKLVTTLRHDNMFWRLQAQRLLVERGKTDVVPALAELLNDKSVDEIGLNAGATHALWVMKSLGAVAESNPQASAVVFAALRHPSAGVRRNAVQVIPRTAQSFKAILECGLLIDPDPQVRLAALLASAEIPPLADAGASLVELFYESTVSSDRWLMDAATSAAARHDQFFLARLASIGGEIKNEAESPRDTSTRTRNERNKLTTFDRVAIVADHYARSAPTDSIQSLVAALPAAGPTVSEAIITGLARGWPKDKLVQLDAPTEAALAQLVQHVSSSARGQVVSLATRWGSQRLQEYAAEIVAAYLMQLRDEKQSDSKRIAAAEQLIDFRKADAQAAGDLLKLISPRASPDLAKGLIEAAGRSDVASVGAEIVKNLASVTPSVRQSAVRVMLSRADWTRVLLDSVDQNKIQLSELSLDQKQALTSHPDRAISRRARDLFARGGGLPNPDRQKVLDELLPIAKQTGDAAAGKEVFKKNCAKCHTHSGEGTKIGPDLTGVAVHPKAQLLGEIIDPSQSVEGNFRVYTIALNNGRILTGLLSSESKTAIEIFDSEGKKHDVQREDIEEMVASTKSLMPEGFEKQVSVDDIKNLLEFLAARLGGKYLPLDLRKVASAVSTRGMFNSEDSQVERLVFRDWSPKEFAGVPFSLVDPQGDRVPNAILMYGPHGKLPPTMPKSVTMTCNSPAKVIHFLSGVSGWGFPLGEKGSVSLIVRLHYSDGSIEDHELKNGVHFADYIRVVDVPDSKLAFRLRGQQLRYLAIEPRRIETIREIELVKGPDATAPIVMATTLEIGE